MKVVIADDSLLILDRLKEMLANYRKVEIVGLYKNGTETLEALKVLKPDLAIVDLKMPGLSGLQVLNEIRKENKTLKFMILTFYSTDYFRQMSVQGGVDYFFNKVDDFGKVSLVVEEMLINEEKVKSN